MATTNLRTKLKRLVETKSFTSRLNLFLTTEDTVHFMVAAYGWQHFFSVEASSAYVYPQPGSHANSVGLYSDELVAGPNPWADEEVPRQEASRPRIHRGG
jgi:hypothetical protein